jgi:hypothetical protein
MIVKTDNDDIGIEGSLTTTTDESTESNYQSFVNLVETIFIKKENIEQISMNKNDELESEILTNVNSEEMKTTTTVD